MFAQRSWNTFYADIDDAKIRAQIDAIVKPRGPNGVTLLSLGFASIGIDEGWEGCKLGVNGTVHYKNGTPTVDPKRFPDLAGLVRYGHSRGAKMGHYLNGCGCNEKVERRINYEGDVKQVVAWGFDGVKIDSCGAQKNMTLYYELFNQSGVPITIENCHQGQNITDGGDPGQMGPGWCPYNLFRTSGDIVNLWDRVMSNLMTAAPFLSPDKKHGGAHANTSQPVSRPGCWAYPDMLEVGRMPEHNDAESRSHFAAWAIVSAPLVLGFDLSDETKMAAAWPIISNEEVIAISQTWVAGAAYPSGRLLKSWHATNVPTFAVRGGCGHTGWCTDQNPRCREWAHEQQCIVNPGYMHTNCRKSCGLCEDGNFTNWSFADGMLRAGEDLCLDTQGQLKGGHSGGNVLHALPCDASRGSQKWRFNRSIAADDTNACLQVYSTWLWDHAVVNTDHCQHSGAPPLNQQWTLFENGTLANGQFGCVYISNKTGPPSTVWAKPLDRKGKMAVLAINGADLTQTISLDFAALLGPAYKEAAARDVWARTDLGQKSALTRDVPPHDCVLLVLSPA